MPDHEIERLRGLLHELVKSSGRSYRDLERSLDLGHGYLNHLFSGRLELKFKHVLLLGRELGFTPNDFFQRAYPVASHEPDWPMQEIEAGFEETGVKLRPPRAIPPADRDALKDLVREVLTELLLESGRQEHTGGRRPKVKRPRRGQR